LKRQSVEVAISFKTQEDNAMFSKMVSMANTPAEVKKDAAMMSAPVSMPSGPKYPYGLCISLDDDCLKKLGLDGDMPAVGEVIHFTAIAKVTSASMNDRETTDGGSEQCCRIELQITDMGVPDPEPKRNWYGGSMQQDNDNDGE
jgi:hypothetical protein